MPELPEVEIARRGFATALQGARVQALHLGKPLRWPLGVAPAELQGTELGLAERRGKYIWLPLLPRGGLLIHLGMSGSLLLDDGQAALGPHQHFALCTERGRLTLTDPRRFGAVVWAPSLHEEPARKLLAGLGPEPFDPLLTASGMRLAWRGRRVAVKQALLDGSAVVGAGNIYACEALFLAGIRPSTPAGRISLARCERLLAAVRQVLGRALELGGSTLRDFSDAHGVAGAYQAESQVYGREGQACRRCGASIQRIVQAQRSTYYCPACQR